MEHQDWYPKTKGERREERRHRLVRGSRRMIVQGRGYIRAIEQQQEKERREAA